MKPRTVGRLAMGTLTVLFALLAVIYAFSGSQLAKEMYHVEQAQTFGLLALCSAVCYRYFEE